MPMKIKQLACAFIIITCSLFGSEISAFKGVPFGVGVSTFLSLYKPGGNLAEAKKAFSIYYNKNEMAVVLACPIDAGVAGGQMWSAPITDSIAGQPANIDLHFSAQNSNDAKLLESRVTREISERALFSKVVASFEKNSFEQIKVALTEKYGAPIPRSPDSVVYEWDNEAVHVVFALRTVASRKPVLVITSKKVKSLAGEARASDI